MTVSINSKGLYHIGSVDAKTLNVVMFILGHIKDRCFREYDESSDAYPSGDDVVISLNTYELEKFHGFVQEFWEEYENMKRKMVLKNN
jgi:hypothetical protein